MTKDADLVIRGGTIVDGTGREPFVGDVAVKDGTIIAVGSFSEKGRDEINAENMLVTPGFIDVHTHYDGQLTWSERCSPSSSHGVTTVVTGNCGVGFAPCRPEDHDSLINLLEGVEDMPEVVLKEGLAWNWETFPEYLSVLRNGKHDIDFAVQLPHSALRLYVMGERATGFEAATADDLAQMRALAREAIEAGAIGFGTSRNIHHTNTDGVVIPTVHSQESELMAIAEGMRDAGGGVIQAIPNVESSKPDLEMFWRVGARTETPVSFTLVEAGFGQESWSDLLDMTAAANQNGQRVTAQIFPRPVGVLLGLDLTINPFLGHPSYQAIAHLPLAERVAEMRKPETRARILGENSQEVILMGDLFKTMGRRFHAIFPLGETPDYEPAPDQSIAALAAARGVSPDEAAYDLLLEDDGHAIFLSAVANYEGQSLDNVRTMI
ncbi:MAG: amidohydrolase family protein, partial [Proteobacteria bacterium]|nr:amidohydrolase family protein [Pseudomonadota bacterium]